MKNKTKRILILVVVLVFCVFILTGCSGNNETLTQPINTFKDEKGILTPLVWPIAWFMHWVATSWFKNCAGSFALSITITTIALRTLAWPIYAKTNDMSLKMAVAQPELDRLNQKYANRTDPQSQQRKQQEMMAIYKKYKISFLGCLMPLIQMPLFLAMYRVVTRIPIGPIVDAETGEVTREAMLQITDTHLFVDNVLNTGVINNAERWTSASFWIGVVLAALVGGTMFLLNVISQKQPKYVKQKPNNGQKNQMASTMKIVNYMMIIMMVFASLSNNALAFYWVIGNIYSIGQTLLNRKLNEIKYNKMVSDNNNVDNLIL